LELTERFPILRESDEEVFKAISAILTRVAPGDAYSSDGSFARTIATLAPGLRAMAATYYLDISLTLDDIGWHFGNFGEPGLVKETEDGLHELGLQEMARWFAEAYAIMKPILRDRKPTEDPAEAYTRCGMEDRIRELSELANAADRHAGGVDDSTIFRAWIKYAREHPERIFD
jgi:hypothetical protein